jgi:hypothetical protein
MCALLFFFSFFFFFHSPGKKKRNNRKKKLHNISREIGFSCFSVFFLGGSVGSVEGLVVVVVLMSGVLLFLSLGSSISGQMSLVRKNIQMYIIPGLLFFQEEEEDLTASSVAACYSLSGFLSPLLSLSLSLSLSFLTG